MSRFQDQGMQMTQVIDAPHELAAFGTESGVREDFGVAVLCSTPQTVPHKIKSHDDRRDFQIHLTYRSIVVDDLAISLHHLLIWNDARHCPGHFFDITFQFRREVPRPRAVSQPSAKILGPTF
jgi:hypothetical protein